MLTNKFYCLAGTKIMVADERQKMFEGRKSLEKTYIEAFANAVEKNPKIMVSTVFLEMFVDTVKNKIKPRLFETAVFFSNESICEFRYYHYHKAIYNHWLVVDAIRKNVQYKSLKWVVKSFLAENRNLFSDAWIQK